MRLKKQQKELVLEWIAEGLQTDEINERAANSEQSFSVSRQQVDWYRARHNIDIAAIKSVGEFDALSTGLAVRANRVAKLQQLAARMEKDLFGGFLWTDQVKSIGSARFTQIVDYEEFNTAEVQQYRGVLDDIAKEVGDRNQRSTNTNVQINWEQVPPDVRDAFIEGKLNLDDVLRKL